MPRLGRARKVSTTTGIDMGRRLVLAAAVVVVILVVNLSLSHSCHTEVGAETGARSIPNPTCDTQQNCRPGLAGSTAGAKQKQVGQPAVAAAAVAVSKQQDDRRAGALGDL